MCSAEMAYSCDCCDVCEVFGGVGEFLRQATGSWKRMGKEGSLVLVLFIIFKLYIQSQQNYSTLPYHPFPYHFSLIRPNFACLIPQFKYINQIQDIKMSTLPKQQSLKLFDKEQQRLFQILTGKIRYKSNPFTQNDLSPDLIMKITVPKSEYIPKNNYLELSTYVAFPSQKLERAFQKAEKQMINQMGKNKENNDPSNFRIRLQKALVSAPLQVKTTRFINEFNQDQKIELESIYQHNGTLDSFSLEYNAIVYILQQICGFRVRAFLLYNQQQQNNSIYLFLSLSSENCVNLGKRYRIKKEIDYSFIDFFLNDPSGPDYRPLKYSSSVRPDKFLLSHIKTINRYFNVSNTDHETTDIIEERELPDQQLNNFRDYVQDLQGLCDYYKFKQGRVITNQQKSYIYEYNRRKINKGCEKLYARVKQRSEFFEINKRLLQKYGYEYIDQPMVYEEFSLPDKHSKNMGFFERLYSLLLYKPKVVTPNGDLDLFLKMEKTKLCYLSIKNHFKINYLKKMGVDFLALGSQYEKFGEIGSGKGGGLGGKNLEQEWPIYSLFSNIDTIRNYVGDSVAFQIFIKEQLISYFLLILVPFAMLFISEQIFKESIYIYTTLLQTLLFAFSYQVYLQFWQQGEYEYIRNYSDSISSKIFLSNYRGAYKRNILTDQVNQFQPIEGWQTVLVNTLCIIIILTLLVIMGGVFHGCRMLLISIYDPLSAFVINAISAPHIIAYLVFFFVADLAAIIATDRIISLMVRLQNPPTDQDQNDWRYTLSFFYLIGLELIPPFFFFIIQPFAATSCYSDSCQQEIQFYVYSRMIITFIVSSFRLSHVFIFKYLRTKQFQKKDPSSIYQGQLANLLRRAMKESKKSEYIVDNNETIIVLVSFSIYCNVLPLVSALTLIALYILFTNSRLALLYETRRPINRSQKIIPFTKTAKIIFFIGLLSQVWISVFCFQFVQINFQEIIVAVSSSVTVQGIFLLKLICVAAYFLILLVISKMIQSFIDGFTNNALFKRKNKKFKEYLQSRGRMKIEIKKVEVPVPLHSLFRTYNPDMPDHYIIEAELNKIPIDHSERQRKQEQEFQHMDSLINMTAVQLK